MIKPRLLWIVEKQFDVAPDVVTWQETFINLQTTYNILLLTGFRNKRINHNMVNNILYYNSLRMPILNRLSSYISQLHVFSHIVSSFKPNLVMINSSNPLLLRFAASVKEETGLRLVVDIRTLPVSAGRLSRHIDEKLFSLNLHYAARHFDGITYITEEMRRFCISTYNLMSHISAIWTSGVNPELFRPELGNNSNGPFKILYHGTIAKKRRLDNVIKAVALLKDSDILLEFLGNGDALVELKDLTNRLGLGGRVKFLNSVDYHDVPRWINHGHVGILPFPDWPGWNTSSPVKLFEYLSCGKPVIVTNIPAHRSVLAGYDFAFWAARSSHKALAGAIHDAYTKRQQYGKLGQAAREFVLKEYTWKQQASKIDKFLKNVLKKSY